MSFQLALYYYMENLYMKESQIIDIGTIIQILARTESV